MTELLNDHHEKITNEQLNPVKGSNIEKNVNNMAAQEVVESAQDSIDSHVKNLLEKEKLAHDEKSFLLNQYIKNQDNLDGTFGTKNQEELENKLKDLSTDLKYGEKLSDKQKNDFEKQRDFIKLKLLKTKIHNLDRESMMLGFNNPRKKTINQELNTLHQEIDELKIKTNYDQILKEQEEVGKKIQEIIMQENEQKEADEKLAKEIVKVNTLFKESKKLLSQDPTNENLKKACEDYQNKLKELQSQMPDIEFADETIKTNETENIQELSTELDKNISLIEKIKQGSKEAWSKIVNTFNVLGLKKEDADLVIEKIKQGHKFKESIDLVKKDFANKEFKGIKKQFANNINTIVDNIKKYEGRGQDFIVQNVKYLDNKVLKYLENSANKKEFSDVTSEINDFKNNIIKIKENIKTYQETHEKFELMSNNLEIALGAVKAFFNGELRDFIYQRSQEIKTLENDLKTLREKTTKEIEEIGKKINQDITDLDKDIQRDLIAENKDDKILAEEKNVISHDQKSLEETSKNNLEDKKEENIVESTDQSEKTGLTKDQINKIYYKIVKNHKPVYLFNSQYKNDIARLKQELEKSDIKVLSIKGQFDKTYDVPREKAINYLDNLIKGNVSRKSNIQKEIKPEFPPQAEVSKTNIETSKKLFTPKKTIDKPEAEEISSIPKQKIEEDKNDNNTVLTSEQKANFNKILEEQQTDDNLRKLVDEINDPSRIQTEKDILTLKFMQYPQINYESLYFGKNSEGKDMNDSEKKIALQKKLDEITKKYANTDDEFSKKIKSLVNNIENDSRFGLIKSENKS